MAELDFSHNVSQIPAGAELPKGVGRQVSAETMQVPDFQSAVNNYAANTNWMSSVGSAVASAASSKFASKLGGELGKNPKGELWPSFTDFDKEVERSYATQAQATLGIQAQKLISQSNLELAAQPRIDEGMIAKAHKQVSLGLEQIYSMAPDSIRPQMEYQYSGVMTHQNEQLSHRMLTEQKEDARNTIELANKVNGQSAHALSLAGNDLDENGDSVAAMLAVQATKEAYESAVDMKIATPLEAKVAYDSARQSMLSGKYTRMALEAEAEGKLPDYLRSLADNNSISDVDRAPVVNNVVEYMNQQASLRLQDQQLKMAQFGVKLAENPGDITGVELAQLQSQLTPLQSQKVKLDFIQALNRNKSDNSKIEYVMAYWGDSNVLARANPEIINKSFDKLVAQRVSSSNNGNNIPITKADAEVEIAASAGASVPVFTKSIQTKLSSGNPQMMEEAAQQMHKLYQMQAGHALAGLSDKDKAVFGAIETARNALDPTEAMREVTNKIYNQDPAMFASNQQQWANYVSSEMKSNKYHSNIDFALKQFGMSKDKFMNPALAHIYGTDILNNYASNFQLLNGDTVTAKRVTQREIDENYGDTGINGGKFKTLHPLEKVLGYTTSDVVPIIQRDIGNQLDVRFQPIKESFLRGETNEYWELEPKSESKSKENNSLPFDIPVVSNLHRVYSAVSNIGHRSEYEPVKVRRIIKTASGKLTSHSFDVVVQGNAFDWDIAVNSESGLRPLYQVAPYMGVINYKPNKQWIDDEYLGRYHNFPNEKYKKTLKEQMTPSNQGGSVNG